MNYPNALYELQTNLESFINIYHVQQNRDEIMLILKDIIGMRKTYDIFNRNLPIRMLDKRDLYYLANTFNDFYKKHLIDINFNGSLLEVEKYFTRTEIDNIKNTIIEKEERDEDVFIFEDVTKVDDKQYIVGKITAKKLIEMVYDNFIKYDFKMQRESEKVTRNGITYETVKIFKRSVKEIAQNMKAGKYRPTAISINILDRSDDESAPEESLETHFGYDEENRRFILSKKDRNSLIDGMHRLYAMMDCYNEDENFEQLMQLNIFFMTQTEARDYIYQEGKKNAISREQLNKFNSSNVYNLITLEIEKEGNKTTNLLQGLLGDDKKDIEILNKFTTFTKFAEALKDNFTIDHNSLREQRLIKRYIIKFFNELLSIYNDDVRNIGESVTKSNKLHCNMIYLYMKIAKKLYGQDEWEDKLFDILNSINNNIYGENINRDLENVSNVYVLTGKNKKKLYEYVDKLQ